MFDIRQYVASNGAIPLSEWIAKLRDHKAKVAIARRLNRLETGNFGDHKSVGGGVWELRIDTGPGYRVYYARAGQVVILLLCGGSKVRQSDDIDEAKVLWADWQERQKESTE